MTPDRLHHASQWFLREATLKAASKAVVDHHHGLPFSAAWDDGRLSSSDGQRFAVQRDGLLGAVYPRYFGYYDRAIALYTHLSDQFGVFATQAISCAPREAGYVLDGLLENDTLVRPQVHTTDTHGFTEQLFGLCHLLGIAFMPRLKDLPDQHLYKLDKQADHGVLEPLFRGTLDTALIAEQWDQLVRIAASLRDRTAPAHVVLQRLINASPADRVSKALTALGRACKTLFVLRYIQEEPTRLMVQRQLNRGEARHALARWLFFANRGEFRVGDYEEVMSKASCLGLLFNAAVLWNTVQIERVVGRLRAGGAEIDPATSPTSGRSSTPASFPTAPTFWAGRMTKPPKRRRSEAGQALTVIFRTDTASGPSGVGLRSSATSLNERLHAPCRFVKWWLRESEMWHGRTMHAERCRHRAADRLCPGLHQEAGYRPISRRA